MQRRARTRTRFKSLQFDGENGFDLLVESPAGHLNVQTP